LPFTEVDWDTGKTIWKDGVFQMKKAVAYKNRSGINDSSREDEGQGIEKFTKCHCVQDWHHLSEQSHKRFRAMKKGLSNDIVNQTSLYSIAIIFRTEIGLQSTIKVISR
jgi:hypothetical protein